MKPLFPLFPLLSILLISAIAFGQSFAPELAPLVLKHRSDLSALEAHQAKAFEQAERPYAFALGSAEKSATASGNLAAVAAITREREGLKTGLLPAEFPEALPKSLQTERKNYLAAVARARAATAARRTAVDADYLRKLATLEPRAAANPELAQQVTAEKQKLLANAAPPAGGRPGGAPASGRNSLVNGTFDVADAEGNPAGWKLPGRDGAAFKVVRDGANPVLRAVGTGTPSAAYVAQVVPIPARAKSVTLKGRVRGKWKDRDTKDGNWGATIDATFLGADEKKFGGWIILVGGREPGWTPLSKTKEIPEGAKALHVHFGLQFVTGTFDFDDLAVEFR